MIDSRDMTGTILAALYDVGPQARSFSELYALELSKNLIGYSASIFEPAHALTVSSLKPVIGSRIQVLPLLLTLVAAFLYW